MSALWIGLAWAALVVAAMWSRRPRRALRPGSGSRRRPADPLTAVGTAARRAFGAPSDPRAARALGAALVLGAVLIPVAPSLVPLPLAGAAIAPRLARRRRERMEARAWSTALPDAVDLFGLALAAGLPLPGALALVSSRIPAPLGPALVDAEVRSRHGQPLSDALDQVAAAGPPARPLIALLLAAHRDGTPVVEPLARLADEQRLSQRRQAETAARQVPIRLLFPLVCCTLPAFALLTVVPPVIVALGDLRT